MGAATLREARPGPRGRPPHRLTQRRQSANNSTTTSVPAAGNVAVQPATAAIAINQDQILRLWIFGGQVTSDAGGVGKNILDGIGLRVTVTGPTTTQVVALPSVPSYSQAQLNTTGVLISMPVSPVEIFASDYQEIVGFPITSITPALVMIGHNNDAVSAHNVTVKVAILFELLSYEEWLAERLS